METFITVTAMMAGAVGLALAARRLHLPYAVALVLAGMALALTPGVPSIRLDPKLAMAFFLPPLLQASAFFTPLRDFRRNLRPILLLALGLVAFTTVTIGWVTKLLLPDLPWAVCFAFGALIAPPDAAAAAAVMSAVAVPRRVVTILEGESLLNDASGLVLYNFAIAAVATGAFSAWGAAASFTFLAIGGLAIGWATGRLATLLSARLGDPLLEITVSFLAAFGSFAAAESVHASGVLATVMCGLTVAWHAPEWMSPRTRLEAKAVWDFAVFVLNTLLFTLIGLELRGVIERSGGTIDWRFVGIGALIASALIVSRFVWVFPVAYGHRFLLPSVLAKDPYPPWRSIVMISWAGMRGVVSMAAALGIPGNVPGRDAVLALTFICILATLVVQGTTLGPLAVLLKLGRDVPPAEADAKLRRQLADAAVDHLTAKHEDEIVGPFARDLTPQYAGAAAAERLREVNPAAAAVERSTTLALHLEALGAQRALLLRLYRAREIDDHAARALEGELDLEELRLHRLRGGPGHVTTTTVSAALAKARGDLLDLSPRNRLIALPEALRATGAVAVVGEKSASVWHLLVTERRSFGFAPTAETAAESTPEASKPKRARRTVAATPAIAAAADPDDLLLSMALGADALPRALLRLEQAARAFVEEQGIGLLFLALGQLHWTDPALPAKPRRAPLILVPVSLTRQNARAAFALVWTEGEVEANETLALLLREKFGITLSAPPDFDERAEDGFAAVAAWMEAVRSAVAGQPGWRVEPDGIALGLFGFAKLLMARDLDHPRVAASSLVATLLAGGSIPRADSLADDADLDEEIRIERLDHVVDADASQTRAIEAARRGQSLVIQGPPGTGKSQTITNIIAQAVLDGKTVLFVAEKLAALSVVKRRLDQVGLGAACLELHSEKASRKAVLAELDTTLKTPRAAKPNRSDLIERLGRVRGRLNRYARALHAPIGATGMTAYDAVGHMVLSFQETPNLPRIPLAASDWTAADIAERRSLVRAMADSAATIGTPGTHAWRGVGLSGLDAETVRRIIAVLPNTLRATATLRGAASALAASMGCAAPAQPSAASALLALARAATAFAAARALAPGVAESAWTLPGLAEARDAIAAGGGFFSALSSSYRAAQALLKQATPNPPSEKEAQCTLLEALLQGQAILRSQPDAATTPAPPPDQVAALAAALDAFATPRVAFVDAAGMDRATCAELADPPFVAFTERLSRMAADPEGLAAWVSWTRARDADPALAPLATALSDGTLQPDRGLAAFDHAVADAVWKAACRVHPELATFDSAQQDRTVDEFRTLDRARLDLARAEVAAAHGARMPSDTTSDGTLQILRGEIAKKRGHMPIRAMLRAAAPSVLAMKPVFMMSPLSVAQFLDPDALAFDMLVIDEASQVEPMDAIGAIARCGQIVVVGDDRQMPPTQFFKVMTGEDDEAPADTLTQARDVESILSLCNARGVPSEMLRWHYRSRHQSLIKVSNDNFYEGRLLVIPSPRARTQVLGLSIVRVEDGVFDSGGDGVNLTEAKAVADAVLRHARETPVDTLGVAAFSISQRDAILDAVEALRRDSPETEAFFNGHADEPFFVKNLENVQGDERDAMYVSIGYAPDKEGRFAMRFGPLSAEGGDRRLNVLITRAKKRCIVFTSISADQIDLQRASGRGVAVLKDFLTYAAGGTEGFVADSLASAADPFARAVQLALAKEAVASRARVGLSGLFLDLAVAAAEGSDLALGIGGDGPFYVLARGARDRDRQRDAALSMMGWKLARTWSVGWLTRPDAETRALVASARAANGTPSPSGVSPAAPTGLAAAYAPAVLEVPKETPIPAMPFAKLADLVAEVVRQEGPVPSELVVLRLATLWAVVPDAAIRAAVQQALRLARELSGLQESGGFWAAEGSVAIPRDRGALPVALRRAALVAPVEWRAAILVLVDATQGATRDELEVGAAKLLGLDAAARGAAAAQLALLEGEGIVAERAQLVVRA